MNKIEEIVNRLNKVTESSQEDFLLKLMNDNVDQLLGMERTRLLEGLDSEGQPIQPPYASVKYADYKLTFNPLGVVDLTLTGAFTGEFIMSATSFPIFFGSLDEKSFSLVQKYGENIFGESERDLEEIRETIVKPGLQNQLRDLLGL